jgi:hypothetical protein
LSIATSTPNRPAAPASAWSANQRLSASMLTNTEDGSFGDLFGGEAGDLDVGVKVTTTPAVVEARAEEFSNDATDGAVLGGGEAHWHILPAVGGFDKSLRMALNSGRESTG